MTTEQIDSNLTNDKLLEIITEQNNLIKDLIESEKLNYKKQVISLKKISKLEKQLFNLKEVEKKLKAQTKILDFYKKAITNINIGDFTDYNYLVSTIIPKSSKTNDDLSEKNLMDKIELFLSALSDHERGKLLDTLLGKY